jgi:hypothetical protein
MQNHHSCISGKENAPVTLPNGTRRSFDDLVSHADEIAQDGALLGQVLLVHADLREFFKAAPPPMEEVLELFGRCKINSFNVRNESNVAIAVAVYLEASAIDHSCVPNAVVSYSGKNGADRDESRFFGFPINRIKPICIGDLYMCLSNKIYERIPIVRQYINGNLAFIALLY